MCAGNTINRTGLPAMRAPDTFRLIYKCYADRIFRHCFYLEEKLLAKTLWWLE